MGGRGGGGSLDFRPSFLPLAVQKELHSQSALSCVPVQADDVSSFYPRTPARAWAQGSVVPVLYCIS